MPGRCATLHAWTSDWSPRIAVEQLLARVDARGDPHAASWRHLPDARPDPLEVPAHVFNIGPARYRRQVCERPPSTGRLTPVIQAARGEARKAMASATSSACPTRPMGWVPLECSRNAA